MDGDWDDRLRPVVLVLLGLDYTSAGVFRPGRQDEAADGVLSADRLDVMLHSTVQGSLLQHNPNYRPTSWGPVPPNPRAAGIHARRTSLASVLGRLALDRGAGRQLCRRAARPASQLHARTWTRLGTPNPEQPRPDAP